MTTRNMTGELLLERFDAAGTAYRTALAEAPAESLGQRRPGEAYTLGGLAHHVNAVLSHYLGTAEAVLAAPPGATTAAPDSSRLLEEAGARAGQTPGASERDAALAQTDELHAAVRRLLEDLDAGQWGRATPVRFDSGEPYPTRPADVLGWLTDHYAEHSAQVTGLLADWRTTAAVEALGRAFETRDAGAVMAWMTEDCVFENTTPAPDGERLTGTAAVGDFWKRFFASTPSARFRTEEAFAAGDRAVVRWTFDWDEGPDNRGHVRGVDVIRVRSGLVAEKLAYVKG
ncbi:MAG TPA: nuclear transport factor 2 family protein [Terriglobales bacterium]|nr:nuclear transport factor 2 family protein [Terriglobales bacterium]